MSERYEILLLTVPELTKDEAQSLEKVVEKTVTAYQGSMISWDRWGKYQLQYPVRKNDYGIYFLARFNVNKEHVNAILQAFNTLCAVNLIDVIMRHMITVLPAQVSLEYKRPESLEEVPAHEVSSFLKDAADGMGKHDKDEEFGEEADAAVA